MSISQVPTKLSEVIVCTYYYLAGTLQWVKHFSTVWDCKFIRFVWLIICGFVENSEAETPMQPYRWGVFKYKMFGYFPYAIIRYIWCVAIPVILDWVLLSAHQDCKSLDGWNHGCPISNDCSALNHGLQVGRIVFHYNALTSPVGYTGTRSQLP